MANAGTKLWLGNQEALSGDYHILEPIAFGAQNSASQGDGVSTEVVATPDKSKTPAVAFGRGVHTTGFQGDRAYAPGDVWGALSAQGGNNGGGAGGLLAASQVRRLTPRECERLQGFTDTRNFVTIRVWSSEHQKRAAIAATQNPRSQTYALDAGESGSHRNANPAATNSNANPLEFGKHAAAFVLIDLERKDLHLRNRSGLNWSANIAEPSNSSPLSIPLDAFAHLIAHMPPIQESKTPDGKAESHLSSRLSSRHQSGSAFVHLSGQEIAELVSDAAKFTTEADLCTKFTTSELGSSFQSLEQNWTTWSSYVASVISGFIPEKIQSENSFDICIETRCGYTLTPHRGKPAADGPRYKALGNSMAVPVMRWIGERIQYVEGLDQWGD